MTPNSNRNSFFLALTKVLLLWAPLLLVSPGRAHGYADPGTGAFMYQSAYAVFLGSAFYLRRLLNRFWRKQK